jgi:hypothetical protein
MTDETKPLDYYIEPASWEESWFFRSSTKCVHCHRTIGRQCRFTPLLRENRVDTNHQCFEGADATMQLRRSICNGVAEDSRVEPGTTDRDGSEETGGYNRSKLGAAGLVSIAAVIALGAGLGASLPGGSKSEPDPLMTYFSKILPEYSLRIAQNDSKSAQGQALSWLSNTPGGVLDDYRIQQRYALAVLYYSTYVDGDGWDWRDGWLVEPDECQWRMALESNCTDSHHLRKIDLRSNNLIGNFPTELELMTKL